MADPSHDVIAKLIELGVTRAEIDDAYHALGLGDRLLLEDVAALRASTDTIDPTELQRLVLRVVSMAYDAWWVHRWWDSTDPEARREIRSIFKDAPDVLSLVEAARATESRG